MFEVAYLVVLYNKQIKDSITLSSMLGSGRVFTNTKLVIWNNGPAKLEENDIDVFLSAGFDVTIVETIKNISLAKIYNNFMRDFPASRYSLLDHDSCVNKKYFDDVMSVEYHEIGTPIIFASGVVKYPTCNGSPCEASTGRSFSSSDVVNSIGSGLIIGRGIVDCIRNCYSDVFDERFYLYGVDTTFFRRVRHLNLTKHIRIVAGFDHSLSKLEVESEKLQCFRKKERSYDLGLTLRYYESFPNNIIMFTKVSLGHMKRKLIGMPVNIYYFDYIFAVIFGRHYRSERCEDTMC